MSKKNISRRGFVAGTGALLGSVGLWPLLARRALAQSQGAVKRVVFWYVPEGCAQQAFWPATGPGALTINEAARIGGGLTPRSRGDSINRYRSAEMGTYCLQPLKPYEADLTLISGFRMSETGDSIHKRNVAAALTGGAPNTGSVDQWLGPFLQGTAPFPSILSTLYGEHVKVGIGADYACPFRTRAGRAASPSWNPVTTYNQVFPNGIEPGTGGPDHRLTSRLHVLGAVGDRLRDVRCQGGEEARGRVEGYLESIERIETETRVLAEQDTGAQTPDVEVAVPADWRAPSSSNRYWHRPENFPTLARIQIDTTVAALALDRTRVSLMQFSATGDSKGIDGSHYKRVGIADLEPGDVNDHHLGHDPNDVRRRNQARIFRWYYAQLAYFIERLKAIPDGAGTLFDSTLIVCCSEFGSYNHRANDVPYLLVGNPGGAFKKGVYLDAHRGGEHRLHADLFLAILRGLGMDVDRFGQSTSPYNDVLQ